MNRNIDILAVEQELKRHNALVELRNISFSTNNCCFGISPHRLNWNRSSTLSSLLLLKNHLTCAVVHSRKINQNWKESIDGFADESDAEIWKK